MIYELVKGASQPFFLEAQRTAEAGQFVLS